jgi:hypothetical protein
VVGNAQSGDMLIVLARYTGDQWLQVRIDGRIAWVAANLGLLQGDCGNVPVSTPPPTGSGVDSDASEDLSDDDGDGDDDHDVDAGDDDTGDDAADEFDD